MNTNSFQIKGVTVAIVSVLLIFYASIKNSDFILIAILPVLLFWFSDNYYLTQERKFRGLYSDLVNGNPNNLKPFEIKLNLYKREYILIGRFFFQRQ